MAFISKGDTLQLTAYLTQKGRDLLLNGSESDITGKYFALGDSDTNYKIQIRNEEGFVPDLTGDNTDCIYSLAENVRIKSFVYSKDGDPVLPPVTPPAETREVRFKRVDNDKYVNVLDCFINLDNIGRYMLYHSADNKGNANSAKVHNSILPLFTNMFKQVDVLKKANENPSADEITTSSDFDFELLFDVNNFKNLINTYLDGDTTVSQTGGIKSPIVLTFSSGASFKGAGPGAIGLHGREIGYAYKAHGSNKFSFYNANAVENKLGYSFYVDDNNQIINQYTSFSLASRVYTKNVNTGSLESLIVKADANLANISDSKLTALPNEMKYANQYLKLFKRDKNGSAIVNDVLENSSVANDGLGIVQKEMLNMRDFIQLSPLFVKSDGTNEFRTSKLTFNVYPKNDRSVKPATLNLVFKYNEDVLLDGDLAYDNITTEGSLEFVTYDFAPTNGVFQSHAKNADFLRNNCGPNSTGTKVTYMVPKGKYTAPSQAEADALAQNDINTNGQAYANQQGECSVSTTYYSAAFSGNLIRNNCNEGLEGTEEYVTVEAGKYTSIISQYDANIKAANYAQELANLRGICLGRIPNPNQGGCLLSGQKLLINEELETILVENVKTGDLLYTAHEITGDLGYYRVSSSKAEEVDSWYKVVTEDNREIKCSPTHLFMVEGKKKVVSSLTLEDKLMFLQGNEFETVKIKSIDLYFEQVTIHKIDVEEAHTYITENMIFQHNYKAPIEDYGPIGVTPYY